MGPAAAGPLRGEEKRRGAAIAGISEMGSPAIMTGRRGMAEYGIPLRRDLEAAFRGLEREVVITMSLYLTWGEEGAGQSRRPPRGRAGGPGACRDAANERAFPGAAMPDHQGRLCGASGNRAHAALNLRPRRPSSYPGWPASAQRGPGTRRTTLDGTDLRPAVPLCAHAHPVSRSLTGGEMPGSLP